MEAYLTKSETLVVDQQHGTKWSAYHGDSCEVMKGIPNDSIHYSIFSPPFQSLFVYSNALNDLGNSRTPGEFYEHFSFIVQELYRTIMPGRLVSFHCMNLPTSKQMDGFIGIKDFRGDLIRLFEKFGFIYHSEVVIYKDPVVAMQRTKALGLLWKQIKKDSAMSRQGIPDYLVTMRKPGTNPIPVSHTADEFPVSQWQEWAKPIYLDECPSDVWATGLTILRDGTDDVALRYAEPVWMDINQSDTLQYRSAREHADERHVCPIQLEVVRRGINLWSNPGEIVFTPFMGIGSEPYVALQEGRRGLGIELKPSYFRQAVANLRNAEAHAQSDLFASLEA